MLRIAIDPAEELARVAYAQFTDDRLDELAAQLLSSPDYQRASSSGTRRQVTERFLVAYADGLSGPAHIRDELYARSQQLAKTAKKSAGLL
jgi:hypothetical protein